MHYCEINFDGLVGPTHNYAGLSYGNVASTSNRSATSSPKKAALQGLAKAKALADRGYPQAILPPHERPSIRDLRAWGFSRNSDAEVLCEAARRAPALLAAASSASAMWTANACIMAPSCDTEDGRVHFTPANLFGNLHRSIEAPFTHRLLERIFADPDRFVVHPPLQGGDAMSDEGAANHTRLHAVPGEPGLHIFVYGRSTLDESCPKPTRFPARQTRESVEAIARLHRLHASQAVFIQQSPEAIDAGVFHNDVISVGNAGTLLYHENAFLESESAVRSITAAYESLTGQSLTAIRVRADELSLAEAVRTYLFNSQLIGAPGQPLTLVTPAECRESAAVSSLLDNWLADDSNPVNEVLTFDLRESMRNGGGPACLRQRVFLNDSEIQALSGQVLLNDSLEQALRVWINRHYRDELHPRDLADPQLLEESRRALDELTGILCLPGLYPFQQ
jgi:succinylarginine dihydrolase